MKKSSLFFVALISFNLSLTDTASAKNKVKKTVAISGALLGKNLDVEKSKPVKQKPVSGNIFYDSTLGKKPAPVATPVPTPVPVIVGAGTGSINKESVRRNQSKETHMSMGMKYLGDNDLNGALGEFKKAQSFSDDTVVKRWIHIVNNKKKIEELNKKIDEINGTKK
jgi:hypothetical protein